VIANTYAEAGDTAIPKRMRLFRVDDSETRTYFVREPEQIIRALNHLSARYDPLKFSVAPTSEDQQVLPALSHGLSFSHSDCCAGTSLVGGSYTPVRCFVMTRANPIKR
jgi:hypothetical protein